MEWMLLSLLLVVLCVVSLLLYLTVRHGLLIVEILQRLQTPQISTEPSFSEPAPTLQEAGSTWLPTDQERKELEQRLLAESRQRAGFARSRRNSMRPMG